MRVATRTDPAESPTHGAVGRAYRRKQRRRQLMTADRLSASGRPVRSALARVPFVVALIGLLGSGIGGVLYLNTKTDESGIRTVQSEQKIADLKLQIEALNWNIASLDATPRIAQQANRLGLVPAGDAAILVIGKDGKATVIGTPAPVTAPATGTAAGGGR